jgi:CBS domain-containing protein
MNIGSIAKRKVKTINFVEPVSRAYAIMYEEGLRHLPVLRNRVPDGMVTDHNVLNHIGWQDESHRQRAMNDRVEKIMRSPLLDADCSESIEKVAQLIVRKNIGAVPLTENGELAGIATKSDFLKCFVPGSSPLTVSEADESVDGYMTASVLTVGPDDATIDALQTMKSKRIQHLPVVRSGELVGMLSDRDILRGKPQGGSDISRFQSLGSPLHVRGLMSDQVQVLPPTATLREAAERMLDLRIGAIPIVEDQRLLGIVSETDLLKVIAGPMPEDRSFQF